MSPPWTPTLSPLVSSKDVAYLASERTVCGTGIASPRSDVKWERKLEKQQETTSERQATSRQGKSEMLVLSFLQYKALLWGIQKADGIWEDETVKKKKHASWRKRGIRWMQMFPFYALLSEPKRMFQSNCRRLVWIVHIIQRRHNHHNVHNFNPIAGTGNLDRSWLILITDHLCDSHLARMSASLMSKG